MGRLYESGRNGGLGARPARDPSKVKWNSKLPKGNQYTTPEREPVREAERERRLKADEEFLAGRKALNAVLEEDADAIKRVWQRMVAIAEGGHYKAGELVLGYAFGKPIATSETFTHDLSGDDLFDAAEAVREQLGPGFVPVPREDEDAV